MTGGSSPSTRHQYICTSLGENVKVYRVEYTVIYEMKTDTRTHAGMAQWYSNAFVTHDLGVRVSLPAP